MRNEKTKMFEMLKNKRGTREYEEWFLKYSPGIAKKERKEKREKAKKKRARTLKKKKGKKRKSKTLKRTKIGAIEL